MAISFESDEEALRKLRERLRKMSDEELIRFGDQCGIWQKIRFNGNWTRREQSGREENDRGSFLRKLGVKVNLARGDLDSVRPFLAASRDFYGVFSGGKGYVGRRVAEELSAHVDFASAWCGCDVYCGLPLSANKLTSDATCHSGSII